LVRTFAVPSPFSDFNGGSTFKKDPCPMRLQNFFSVASCWLLQQAILVSLAILSFWAFVGPAGAGDLIVRYDQSQLLRLPRPASEVIIGNPSIADVSLNGGNMLVVTGKTFGITNVIALDVDRNVIQDQRVVVVNLHKGGSRFTYSCSPNCETNLTIGDNREYFDMVKSHNNDKTKFSEGAAESSSGPSNGQ
jgi:Flp pilus assembly secretin CpaC